MFSVWFGAGPAPGDSEIIGPLRLLPAVTVGRGPGCAWAMAANTTGHAVDPTTGVQVWAWARLDNRSYLTGALGAAPVDDTQLILAAYLHWGARCPEHLRGDFSVCIQDPRTDSLTIFRDPLGVRPLAIGKSGSTVVVTTAPGLLWRLPGFDTVPDPLLIAQLAVRVRGLSMAAAHPQATRVLPGTVVTISDGSTQETKYHSFTPHSAWSSRPEPEWVDEFRAALLSAVAARVPTSGPIVVEFSGGLDSVGIAALLHDLDPAAMPRVRALGTAMQVNEEPTMRAAAEALGIDHLDINPERDEENARDWWFGTEELLGEPTEHDIALQFTSSLAQYSREGAKAVFAGLGGDEGVTYAALQAPREYRTHLAPLSAARYALPRRGWRRQASAIRTTLLGSRPFALTAPATQEIADTFGLRPEILEAAGVAEQLAFAVQPDNTTSVNAAIVEPTGHLREITANYWSRRAEECNTVASQFDMTYVFPLLDPTVIQQYLSTPTVHKYRKGLGRYLFREAVGPTLPDSIRWATSKWMGPEVTQRAQARRPWTAAPVHGLLADIMQPGAELPARSPATGMLSTMNGLRRVNLWLHQQFPDQA